ncbi:hypothetical protein [Segetibacter koreensis]|uniref:hypothetical protein n=1 Tax=Segetibacter koreensis TaxID=398037 RepID=UPI00037BCB4C|nr:hypothetical protein [Segetibacter koreensis]
MASISEQFETTGKMRTWSMGLIGVGLLAFIIGFITKGLSSDEQQQAIFWGTLLYNSVFFLLICNASMFFICVTTLAHGGWQVVFRRVPEAISAVVPIFGVIAMFIMFYIVFGLNHGGHNPIYHWVNPEGDKILEKKSGFLNPVFFVVWTILSIGLWSYLGMRMRSLSRESDESPMNLDQSKKWVWKNTVTASLFTVWFGLTVGSTTPWFWLMSIDSHWYSTMFSWYTFASAFVSGIALITIFVIYLKNRGYLEYTNDEHLHDLGKFMFAFSIFWTYLWFSQYMLIWYSNQPEETAYFQPRTNHGVWKGIFYLNLVINFVCPLLILMTKSSKRNYTLMTFMAILILFGHWLDFNQMVMASISRDQVTLSLLDFGIMALYAGMIIFFVGRALAKVPLVAKNNPFLKESIIHHT